MKKHVMLCVLALALTLCVFALARAEGGQVSPLDNLPTAAPSQLSYNPATEEDGAAVAAAASVNRIYAGATPIPIDPIDMPTPTPRPELTFTFGEYVSTKLGLTFKSAVGYEINENISGKYILTEPAAAVKDTPRRTSMSPAYPKVTPSNTTSPVKSQPDVSPEVSSREESRI